ncbi:MAG TPA: acyl-CoA synthetase [Euryarchaeota archaeon]|nr:MAG: acyl-CoA synthetase [Thermoplasmatales archaeon ex4484_6]HHD16698.1 acyl-CoA synthetase [Euryarchaeota archaeon]
MPEDICRKKLDIDYETLCKEFKWEIPEYYNFGFEVVDKWAEDRTKLALVSIHSDGEKASYDTFFDLKCLSDRFANVLLDLGVKKGDRVLVMLESVPEWYVVMIAMFKLGVIPMPGTVLLTSKDIKYRINRAEANMVITDVAHVGRVDRIADDCPTLRHKMVIDAPVLEWLYYRDLMDKTDSELDMKRVERTKTSDPMLLYFTSGTTGNPKMVLHTHSYPIGHYVTARFAQSLTSCDLHWTVSETGWAKAAWGKLFGQMIVGAAIIQWETPGRFDPDGLLRAMERHGVTSFCAPPTVYRLLIQQDLSRYNLHLRHCMSAGEPLNPEVIKVWKETFGLDIYDFYGQTETVCVLSNFPFMPIKYGSVGKPTPGHDVRIVDDEGNELPPGVEGNIALYLGDTRPPGLMKEYWKDEEAMKRAFHHGFYFTGDRAYRDEDGYFWFVGRDDDVIKSSGYRIGPFEVESALMEHPAVAECAVVGAPDPDGIRGIVVKAYIILAKGYEPSDELTREIQDHVKKTTAPYKYPRIVEYVKELPKTISGKIKRKQLRESSSG